MEPDYGGLARAVRAAAESKKGLDPVILDVRGLSEVADYLVVVTARSAPHLRALDEEIDQATRGGGRTPSRLSGTPESGWMVRDFYGVIVHLMTEERRRFYALETLWNDAPRVG